MNSLPDFVISDTHFGHKNIGKYTQRYTPMFPNMDAVDTLMKSNWNGTVGPKQTILHLGDLLNPAARGDQPRPWLNALSGKKYILSDGNHDHFDEKYMAECGFTMVDPFILPYKGWDIIFSHYPLRNLYRNQLNVHGHIHNNPTNHTTRQHLNVSVEVRAFCPQPLEALLDSYINLNEKVAVEIDYDHTTEARIREFPKLKEKGWI